MVRISVLGASWRNLARNHDACKSSQPEGQSRYFYLETFELLRAGGAERGRTFVRDAQAHRTRPVALFLFRHAARRRSPWSGARLRNLSPPRPSLVAEIFSTLTRDGLVSAWTASPGARPRLDARDAPRARSRSRTPEADIPTPASPSSEPQRRHGRRPRAPLQAETTPQHDRSLARAHARGQPRQAERRRRGTEGEVARAVARARREGFRARREELDPRVRVRLPDAPPGRALSPTPRRCRVVRLGERQR